MTSLFRYRFAARQIRGLLLLWRTLSACRVETPLDAWGGSATPVSLTYRPTNQTRISERQTQRTARRDPQPFLPALGRLQRPSGAWGAAGWPGKRPAQVYFPDLSHEPSCSFKVAECR